MESARRFQTGLTVGLKSFDLLWKHKKLIFYFGAPMLAGVIAKLFIHNFFFFSPSDTTLFVQGMVSRMWETYGWAKHIGVFLTKLILLLVVTFAAVALTHHTFAIIKKRKSGIRRSIKACIPKLDRIALWTVILTLVYFLIHHIDMFFLPMYHNWMAAIVPIFARIVWWIPMLFVIPALALDEKPLSELIKKSPQITKKMFYEYLGAIFWIGLIGLLAFIPIWLFLMNKAPFIVVHALVQLIFYVCATVHAILKTILYQQYAEPN